MLAKCEEKGLTFIGYAPLGGLATRRGERPLAVKFPACAAVAAVRAAAAATRRPPAGGDSHPTLAAAASESPSPEAVYLAYLLRRARRVCSSVLLIVGARRVEHAVASVGAAYLHLSDDEVARLDRGWPA